MIQLYLADFEKADSVCVTLAVGITLTQYINTSVTCVLFVAQIANLGEYNCMFNLKYSYP